MSREDEIKEAESSKIEKVKELIKKIDDKKSKFLFFVPDTINPAASIYEIYKHATVVKNLGYEVLIMTEKADQTAPFWIESELTDHKHQSAESAKLSVTAYDVLVIPEIFSNVMEQVKNLPCIKVALLQSIDYMINALLPTVDFTAFNITDVIMTSKEAKKIVDEYYGANKYNISICPPTIPDYFKSDREDIKRPVISIVGRNPKEIGKVVKLFYSKYPQYSWITFDSMITESKPPRALTRQEYAKRLKTNFAGVWVDRISTFGTFPLECMKANTIPVGLLPDIIPDYLLDEDENFVDKAGTWTTDLHSLPILIGDVVTAFIEDSIGDDVFDTMERVSDQYSSTSSDALIAEIYQNLIAKKYDALVEFVNESENNKETV